MGSGSRPRSLAWGVALAVGLNLPAVVEWWHPQCATRDDGPTYFAWGLPIPYAQPTGVSSGEFAYLPITLGLDLMLLGAFGYWIAGRLLRRVDGWSLAARRAVLAAGICLCVLSSALLITTLGISGISAGALSDALFSYRPAPIARLLGGPPCVN